MIVGQRFLKHAIPWFVGVGVDTGLKCNSTHGPSRELGKSLVCPCDSYSVSKVDRMGS